MNPTILAIDANRGRRAVLLLTLMGDRLEL